MLLLLLTACAAELPVELSLCEEMPSVVEVTWPRQGDAAAGVRFGPELAWLAAEAPGAEGDEVRVFVAGGRPGEALRLQAFEGERESAELEIELGDLPAAPADFEVEALSEDDGRWILTTLVGDHDGVLVLDRGGAPVWYWPLPEGRLAIDAELTLGGQGILVLTQPKITDVYDGRLLEIGLDGALTREVSLPDAHHALAQRAPGEVLVNAHREELDDDGQRHLGQSVLSVDAAGEVERVVDLWDISPGYYGVTGEFGPHGNGLYASPDSDTLLWTLLGLGAVVEVDLDSGSPLWGIGDVDGALDWPEPAITTLHAPSRTPDGELMIFDNGDLGRTARVLSFSLDLDEKVVEERWSVPWSGGGEVLTLGDAHAYEDGHLLVSWGMRGEIEELDAARASIWRARTPAGTAVGNVTRVDALAP